MKQKIKHLSQRQRNERYALLKARDGEYCHWCGEKGYKKKGRNQLDIERVDNTKGYEDGNIAFAHHRCNIKKDPRGVGRFSPRALTSDDVEPKLTRSAEMHKNQQAEPKYRLYVLKRVMKSGRVAVSELVNAGAEKAHISQQTAKRYLDKLCSTEGSLMYDDTTEPPSVIARSKTNGEASSAEDALLDASKLAEEVVDGAN